MQFSSSSKKIGSESKNTIVSTFLVANAFVWYLGALKFLGADFKGSSLLFVISVNIACLSLAALSVTLLMNRFKNRLTFLKYWIFTGLLLSAFYAFLDLTRFSITTLIASGILGIYFGVGMPICMGYFSATTKPENRAKSGAMTILMIGLGFPILTSIDTAQPLLVAVALAAWRVLAFISIFVLTPSEKIAEPKYNVSYRSVISNKAFLLYLIPWFMFVLINDLTMEINTNYFNNFSQPLANNYLIIENILSGISAVICGFLADKKGRKRIALVAFALLGIGYASLGIFNTTDYLAAWFYVCADGIAWGAFSMLFLITLWGDIAQEKNSEKYYFLGVLPYLLSNFIGFSIGPLISKSILGVETIFSFASFFLFLAILPLVYAPETLSDRIIRNIDLNGYVKKALEKAKKERGDEQKTQADITPQKNAAETDESRNRFHV